MSEEKIILPDSPEAAQYRTDIKGWVSASGRFWGKDEAMARSEGSTHKVCEKCGTTFKKERGYSLCDSCLTDHWFQEYLKRDHVDYSPDMVVVIHNSEDYFFDEETLRDHLWGIEQEEGEVYLEVCEPQYLNEIDVDIWTDVLPMDADAEDCISKEVLDLLDQLNKKISEHKAVSWIPGKKRTTYHFKPE